MVNIQACHMICKKCGAHLDCSDKGSFWWLKTRSVRNIISCHTISEEIYQINCKFDGEIPKEEAPVEEAPVEEAPASEESKDSKKKE